jgi:hypothetical protein
MNQGSISINQGSLTVSSTITSSSSIRGTKYVCAYGESIAYNYNWNSTGFQGWFIYLNDYFSGNNGNAGCSYLTIALSLVGTSQFNCFCRVLLTAAGETTIIIDSKYPTTGSYEFFLTHEWDGGGVSAL